MDCCALLVGPCVEIKLVTSNQGQDWSWSLGTCSSNQKYIRYSEYITECCLNPGMYTLKCTLTSTLVQGWNGAFIEFEGTQYCKDFLSGYEKAIPVIIRGKYRFSKV